MNKIKIIAEAGVNHNGKIKNAIKLAEIAKKAGADYIKFQIYKTENLIINKTRTAKYQKKNSGFNDQFKMLKKYELSFEEHYKIFKYCKKINIEYLASVFDEESLDFLKKFDNKVKIGSGEITNLPLLNKIAFYKMNAILSTGASTINDVKLAVKILKKNKLAILHCHSNYPSKQFKYLNLNCIKTYLKIFKTKVGYSDHTESVYASILALGLGATIFEKHITINNKFIGPDHMSSMNPQNFFNYVKTLRFCGMALGDGIKRISPEEMGNISLIRKSIYAKTTIRKGEKFSYKNLITLRPNNGINANKFFKLLGKKSKINYSKYEKIKSQ